MGGLKKLFGILILLALFLPGMGQENGNNSTKKFVPGDFVMEHIQDSYHWHITDIGSKQISISLPVILYSKYSGLTFFMKMVSAAKLKKAQDSIFRVRPYSTKLFDMVSNLVADKEIVQNIPLAKTPSLLSNVTLVVFTANGSLCGTFNANAIKLAERAMEIK